MGFASLPLLRRVQAPGGAWREILAMEFDQLGVWRSKSMDEPMKAKQQVTPGCDLKSHQAENYK